MNDYFALRVKYAPHSEDADDLLAAFLSDENYESFEPGPEGLIAYIKAEDFDAEVPRRILESFPIRLDNYKISYELIEGKDWNEEWEKNYFKPIVIGDRCVIHSTFHKDVPRAEYDIVVDPKMAFGTGHHATTSMMLRHILSLALTGKDVIDMGTGTGILAILARMRGAKDVYGIEIDPAACINARENVALNAASMPGEGKLEILEGDSSRLAELPEADIFLANINRNVILADLRRYVDAVKSGGMLIFSGFYEADITMLERAATLYGLKKLSSMTEDGGWASIRFVKE